jgi:thiol:disulfide interchange protein DsbD
VRTLLKSLFLPICFGVAALSASAGHTQARLVLANEMAGPGETVLAGVRFHMDPQWYTFWKNPGDSGVATSMKWDSSWTVSAGDIQWPVPEKLTINGHTNYGYRDDVILLVPVKIAYGVPRGSLDLKATVFWQECKDEPAPGSAEVHATLSVGRENRPSTDAQLLNSWQKKLPQSGATLSARAWWEGAGTSDVRKLILEWNSSRDSSHADFFPYGGYGFEVNGATERIPASTGNIRIRKQVKSFNAEWPSQISGLLIEETSGKRLGFDVTLSILKTPQASAGEVPPLNATTAK